MGSSGRKIVVGINVTSALAIAMMAGLASPAVAQTSNASATAQQSATYDIAAQPLSQALAQWTAKSGIRTQSMPQAAEQVRSGAAEGNLSAIAALDALLANTGYSFRFSRADAIVIEAAVPEAAGSIGTVRVQGTTEIATQGVNGSTDTTATEGSDSYAADQTTVATKLPLSIKDTPQSVSVITQQQLQDRNVTDLQRAIMEAPGISTIYGSSGGVNSGRSNLEPSFYSRGFLLERLQIDGGAPLSITPYNPGSLVPALNMAAYDHVEILRGADGLLDGSGNPGGVINLERKRPLDHAQLDVSQLFESYKGFNTTIDGSEPIAFDGNLKARFVFNRQSNDYFYKVASNKQVMLYLTLEAQLTPTTVIAGGINYQSQDAVPFFNGLIGGVQNGQAIDLHLPRSTCFCFSFNRQSYDTRDVFARVEQSFGGDWKLKINADATRQISDYSFAGVVGTYGSADPYGQPRLSDSYGHNVSTLYALDGTVGGSFKLLGKKQTLVVGGNYSSFDGGGTTQYTGEYLFGGPAVDPYTFNQANYSAPFHDYVPSGYTPVNRTENIGAYATFRFTPLKPLHLTYGVRYNRYVSRTDNYLICRSTFGCYDTDNEGNSVTVDNGGIYSRVATSSAVGRFFPAGYLAAALDLTKAISIYASRTAIYIDNSIDADVKGNPLPPTTGNNYETGIKYASLDHRLTASVAAFSVEQKAFPYALGPLGNAQANPITGRLPNGRFCCFVSDPNNRKLSRGFDAEIAGEVLPGFQVSASYTYNKTKQHTSTAGAPVEPIESESPENLYKIWLRYAFRPGSRLRGAYFGTGLLGQSRGLVYSNVCTSADAYGCSNTSRIADRLPPYLVVSFQAGYEVGDRYSIGVTVNNLLDKRYYTSVGLTDGGNWYGAPRNISVALRGRF